MTGLKPGKPFITSPVFHLNFQSQQTYDQNIHLRERNKSYHNNYSITCI